MTTNEIATVDEAKFVPAPLDPIDTLMRYADAIEVAHNVAKRVCMTEIVPKIYRGKPHDAAVAILHGSEIGLNPLQSLQNIFPVHGMPSIYAKTMVGLLMAKGYKFKTIETGPTTVTYSGWWPGREPETSTWTIERAIQAGFVPQIDPKTGVYARSKYDKLIGNEKYLTQPEEMLWAKAATTVCKRLAPHVLLGLGIAEDQEDRPEEPIRVTSERLTAAEIAPTAADADGPVVQQWQPPAAVDGSEPESAAASDPGEKPDTAQVIEAETEQTKPAAKRTRGRKATEPVPEPAAKISPEQQEAASVMLDRLGATTREAKQSFIRNLFERPDLEGALLTEEEGQYLLQELRTEVEKLDAAADGSEANQ